MLTNLFKICLFILVFPIWGKSQSGDYYSNHQTTSNNDIRTYGTFDAKGHAISITNGESYESVIVNQFEKNGLIRNSLEIECDFGHVHSNDLIVAKNENNIFVFLQQEVPIMVLGTNLFKSHILILDSSLSILSDTLLNPLDSTDSRVTHLQAIDSGFFYSLYRKFYLRKISSRIIFY